MSLVAAVFGLFIVAMGALGIASPPRLLALVERSQSRRGLYLLAGMRVGVGAALFLAAGGSRAPEFLRILGVIAIVAGVVTPFFGAHRSRAVLDWWSLRPAFVLRSWCLLAVLLGAAIIWAVSL